MSRLISIFLIFALATSSSADIQFAVSENFIARHLEEGLPTLVNRNIKNSPISGLQLLGRNHKFTITNLPEEKEPFSSDGPDLPITHPFDLQLSKVKTGGAVSADGLTSGDTFKIRIQPSWVHVQSDKPVVIHLEGPGSFDLKYKKDPNAKIHLEDVKNIKISISHLRFKTKGGLSYEALYQLKHAADGTLSIHQTAGQSFLDPNSYEIDFGDINTDFTLDGRSIDKNSPEFKKLMKMAQDYARNNPKEFAQTFQETLGAFLKKQIDDAFKNSVNPSLIEAHDIHVMDAYKHSLDILSTGSSVNGLAGRLTAEHCAKKTGSVNLNMNGKDWVVGIDSDELNSIFASDEVDLDEIPFPNGGKLKFDKIRPRITMQDGRLWLDATGEYVSGTTKVEDAARGAVGLDRIEGHLLAEVQPRIKDGNLEILVTDLKAAETRVFHSGDTPGKGVRTRYEKLPDGRVQVIVDQSSFDELAKAAFSRGALSKEMAVESKELGRVARKPRIIISENELQAQVGVMLKTDILPKKAREAIKENFKDPYTKKDLQEIDGFISVKLKPSVVTDASTGKKLLQLDLAEISEVRTQLLDTYDPARMKGTLAGLDSWLLGGSYTQDTLKEYADSLKGLVIEGLQTEIKKQSANTGTNTLTGITLSVPSYPIQSSTHSAPLMNLPIPYTTGTVNTAPLKSVGSRVDKEYILPVARLTIDTTDPKFRDYFSVPFKEMGNEYEFEGIELSGKEAKMIWKTKKLQADRTPLVSISAAKLFHDYVRPKHDRIFRRIIGTEAPGTPPTSVHSVEINGDVLELGGVVQ